MPKRTITISYPDVFLRLRKVKCPSCGWRGRVFQTVTIKLQGILPALACPKCREYVVGYIFNKKGK